MLAQERLCIFDHMIFILSALSGIFGSKRQIDQLFGADLFAMMRYLVATRKDGVIALETGPDLVGFFRANRTLFL